MKNERDSSNVMGSLTGGSPSGATMPSPAQQGLPPDVATRFSAWRLVAAAPALATALSAWLFALSAPPQDQGWLAWLAPIPFFWALLRTTLQAQRQLPLAAQRLTLKAPNAYRSAASLGFLHGFLYLLFLVPWFGAFSPGGYPVAAVYWGLLSAAVIAATVAVIRRAPVAIIPGVLASGWTVLEWLRAQGMLAFPWGTLAATQHKNLVILQMLDLSGAYGLSFLMALLAGAAATALQGAPGGIGRWGLGARGEKTTDGGGSETVAAHVAPSAQRPTPNALLGSVGVSWALGTLVLIGLLMVRSVWVMAGAKAPREKVRVALVQASESQKAAGAAVVCVSPLEEYESRTRTALQSGAELVVWPESACEGDAVNSPEVRRRLIDLLWGSKAHLLVGSFVDQPESGMTTNSSVMMSPRGRILGQYAKVLIVPFGEYLPFRPLLRWTERLGMPAQDVRAGDKWAPVPWERGKVGVSICFESAFGFISRMHVNQGANLLAVLTSDGWAGRDTAGLQHAAFAPLRAVETRRSVARAAATGVSQLIDPYGRPIQQLSMFKKGVVIGDLPLRTDITLYARLGDWPVALAWLVLVITYFRGYFRRRTGALATGFRNA